MRAILVINDSPEFLELMHDFLSEEGYAPAVHAHAEGVLDKVRAVRPALIVLDLVLGDADGWIVLTQLRADDDARAIPVILCTAAAEQTRQQHKLLATTGVRVIEKPFDLDHMLSLIVELVGPPHTAPAAVARALLPAESASAGWPGEPG